jgi:hypothetical protein
MLRRHYGYYGRKGNRSRCEKLKYRTAQEPADPIGQIGAIIVEA